MTTITNPIESRLAQYIVDNGLHAEQPLPGEEELASLLQCAPEQLSAVLQDMAGRGVLKHCDWGGWAVLNPEAHSKKEVFSLSRAALLHGHRLETKVVEKLVRLPLDDTEIWSGMEKNAQRALGLAGDEPFILIVRLRKLVDTPADAPQIALHRVYLKPARFPKGFLDAHDFAQESLAHIYAEHGYQLTRRDTSLRARPANLYEINDFHHHGYDVVPHAVLHAEQELFATDPAGKEVCLEFLQASYVNWTYTINNRPAS